MWNSRHGMQAQVVTSEDELPRTRAFAMRHGVVANAKTTTMMSSVTGVLMWPATRSSR